MPLREFDCRKCDHTIERIESLNPPPPPMCEQCGEPMTQVIAAPAIAFRGRGWAVDGYVKKMVQDKIESGE